MHAIFIPYGRKEWVDVFLNDLRAQKLTIRLYRKNPETNEEEEKHIFTECQLRLLPGGLYEFVFPKEHMDIVLTGLGFHNKIGYEDFNIDKEFNLGIIKIKPIDLLRKYLRIEPIPEFNSTKELMWSKVWVSIIPIGIRHELGDVQEKYGEFEGWWHEGI